MRVIFEKNNHATPLVLKALIEQTKQALHSLPKESKQQLHPQAQTQTQYLSQLIELGKKQGYLLKSQINEAKPADVEVTVVESMLKELNIKSFDNIPSPDDLMLFSSPQELDDLIDMSSCFIVAEEEKFSDSSHEFLTSFPSTLERFDRLSSLRPNPEYSEQKLREELSVLFNMLDELLSKKTNQLKTDNKKMLIVVGEGHLTRKSLLIEFILLKLLNKYGIEHLVSETTEELLATIRSEKIDNGSLNFSFLLPLAEKNGFKIIAGELDNHQSDFQREETFKQKISNLNNHCMFITGMGHLPSFITDEELSKQFEILIINAANLSEQDKALYKSQEPTVIFEAILHLVTMPEVAVQANVNTPIDHLPAERLFCIVDDVLNKIVNKDESTAKFSADPAPSTKHEVLKKEAKDSLPTSIVREIKNQTKGLAFERSIKKKRTSHHRPHFIQMIDSMMYRPFHSVSSFERPHFSTAIDFATEPAYYYHSTGAMNPMKLIGILKQGILSKYEAEKRGLIIDANGIQCNGTHYVSTATHFGGCMNSGDGAFHFVIEREKLTTTIRKNPEQDMPTERQVYLHIPRGAIKAVQLEKEGFMDIEHPSIKLGIGCFEERATAQVSTYVNFMLNEFGYEMPQEDVAFILKNLHDMKTASLTYSDFHEKQKATQRLEANIESIIKKHLKLCLKKLIMKDIITPYDILRYYDKNIPVYDHHGNDIYFLSDAQKNSSESKPIVESFLLGKGMVSDNVGLISSPRLLFNHKKKEQKLGASLITKTQNWTRDRGWSENDTKKFVSAISTIEEFDREHITKILAQLNWMNPDDIAEEYFDHVKGTAKFSHN